MALTAAQIQARIDSLQKAMDAGVLLVQHGQDRVQYQSYTDMARSLARLKSDLDTANGAPPRSRVNYIKQESKGFGRRHGPLIGEDFS